MPDCHDDERLPEDHNEDDASSRPRFIDHASQAAQLLNNLLEQNLPLGIISSCSQVRWQFDLEDVIVQVYRESDGISVYASSAVVPRRHLDPLRQELRVLLVQALSADTWNTLSFGIFLLQTAETAAGHLQAWREHERAARKLKAPNGWDSGAVSSWQDVLENPHGVDLLSVNDTAQFVLGQPIAKIISNIPDELRVIHVEPVFRADLVKRFLRRRQVVEGELMKCSYEQLRKCINRQDVREGKVEDTLEGIAEYLSAPRVTFHGAPKSVMASIVRYGFILPGERVGKDMNAAKLEVRCGASYGVGIYSSPSLDYACMYAGAHGRGSNDAYRSPSFRVVVCATIMGRPLQVNREQAYRSEGVFREGAHSHVSPNGLEYIVFDKAQIVPCYVLHLDLGAERARAHFDAMRRNPTQLLSKTKAKARVQTNFAPTDDCPAAVVAKKAALKAAATKWFPYGFGSATGTNFVIEDIAPVDDDEEDYGDFQAMRVEQELEVQQKMERSADEKVSWFDEYQTARETWGSVKIGDDI
ncbi:hypothetical protein Slin14017_G123040 [Septoria linicola]|nr:hypothetical protein Slin14017_G123040 [Septoria linicola]